MFVPHVYAFVAHNHVCVYVPEQRDLIHYRVSVEAH